MAPVAPPSSAPLQMCHQYRQAPFQKLKFQIRILKFFGNFSALLQKPNVKENSLGNWQHYIIWKMQQEIYL